MIIFAIVANPDLSGRRGTLTVAEQTVTVTQDAWTPPPINCLFSVSPTSAVFDPDAASGGVSVTSPATCTWTAVAHDVWVTITSGSAGAGSGSVTYTVTKNEDTAPRATTLTVAGVSVAIGQAGNRGACTYSVTPVRFTPCMHVGVEMTAAIDAAASCPWTASPGADWISITGAAAGTGSGIVGFTVSDNYLDPRSSVLMLRWPTPTAGQNLQVLQAGCRYALSSASLTVGAAGGSSSVNVYQQSDPLECGGPLQNGCVWRAVSSVSWITITSRMPKAGDDTVFFQVASNAGGGERSGTIVVNDKVLHVFQDAGVLRLMDWWLRSPGS